MDYKINIAEDLFSSRSSPQVRSSLHRQKLAIEIELIIENELKLLKEENDRIRQFSNILEAEKQELAVKNKQLYTDLLAEKDKTAGLGSRRDMIEKESTQTGSEQSKEQLDTYRKLCKLLEDEKEELKEKVRMLEAQIKSERVINSKKISGFDRRLISKSIVLKDRTNILER